MGPIGECGEPFQRIQVARISEQRLEIAGAEPDSALELRSEGRRDLPQRNRLRVVDNSVTLEPQLEWDLEIFDN